MKSISNEKESDKFNKLIKECEEYSIHLDKDCDITKSFPRFLLNLYFKLDPHSIEEALRGLGSCDEGIDAFFVSEETKQIYIIQFKSRKHYDEKEGCDAKKEWFALLSYVADNLKTPSFKTKNKRVSEIREQILNDYNDYALNLFIFHLGHVSNDIEGNYPTIKYVSMSDIIDRFVQFYEADLPDECAPDEIEFVIKPLHFKELNVQSNYIYFTPKARNGKTRKTIVFPITGEQIINLLKKGTTILERNVRGYLGDSNTVNKGIIQTALDCPEYFYFYNNGISITCDSFELVGNGKLNPILKLKRPQIINGAQTVNGLKSAYETKLKRLKRDADASFEYNAIAYMQNIHVLCKVMESNKSKNSEFTKDITQYNNTQNKIKPTDFYANRPEQKIIKAEILKYGITYNIKRGKTFESEKDLFISMEDLGENHLGQTQDPFFAKASKIFVDGYEDLESSSYTCIFGNNGIHNFKRTLELTKTFYIFHYLSKHLMSIKRSYDEIETLIGKDEDAIRIFENKHSDFFKMTGAKKYFDDFVKHKVDPYIDIVSLYIRIMDFKILSYIIRQIIEMHSVVNHEGLNKKLSTLMEGFISQNDICQISLLIQRVIRPALKIYAEVIKEVSKDNKIFKRHPKTKEIFKVFEQRISEFVSDDENYIKYEF